MTEIDDDVLQMVRNPKPQNEVQVRIAVEDENRIENLDETHVAIVHHGGRVEGVHSTTIRAVIPEAAAADICSMSGVIGVEVVEGRAPRETEDSLAERGQEEV